jgi:hypothetical protein
VPATQAPSIQCERSLMLKSVAEVEANADAVAADIDRPPAEASVHISSLPQDPA